MKVYEGYQNLKVYDATNLMALISYDTKESLLMVYES